MGDLTSFVFCLLSRIGVEIKLRDCSPLPVRHRREGGAGFALYTTLCRLLFNYLFLRWKTDMLRRGGLEIYDFSDEGR